MKFIHCSDIHLDSKMERNLSAAQARERNAEICATFERLVQFARRKGVRAVLIAGDLFDTARASAQTAGFLLNLVSNAPEVDFLYLRGNHDEADRIFEGLQIPENFKTFSRMFSIGICTSCEYPCNSGIDDCRCAGRCSSCCAARFQCNINICPLKGTFSGGMDRLF